MSLSASQASFATCGVCYNSYDSTKYVPKLLPCAHTVCSVCIPHFQNLKCPTCRNPLLHKDPSQYKTNYALIEMIDGLSQRAQAVSAAASLTLSSSAPTPAPSPVPSLSSTLPSSENPASLPAYPDSAARIAALLGSVSLASSSASQTSSSAASLASSNPYQRITQQSAGQPSYSIYAQTPSALAPKDDYGSLRNQCAAQVQSGPSPQSPLSSNPYGSLSSQRAAQATPSASLFSTPYGSLSAQPAAQTPSALGSGDGYGLLRNQPAAQSGPSPQAPVSSNPYGSLSSQPAAQANLHFPAPQSKDDYGPLKNQTAAQTPSGPQPAPSLFGSQGFQEVRPMGNEQVERYFAHLSHYYMNPEEAKRIHLNHSINNPCVYEDKFTTGECLQALNEYPIGSFITCVTNNPGFTEQQLQSFFYFKIVYKNNLGQCVCRYITYDKNDLRVKLYKKEGSALVQDPREFPCYLGNDPASAFKLHGVFWTGHLFPTIFEHLKSGQF